MSTSNYLHGHHESVLRSHRTRNATNSAAFLIPHLRSEMRLLDVGCGPATVTCDLAEVLADGEVVGVDTSSEVIDVARNLAMQRGLRNIEFAVADAYQLPFDDGCFDVVFAHQVLQHLTDPVAAFLEMCRVANPGGIVAVRDADFAAMTWYPEVPGLTEWNRLMHEVSAQNGNQIDAGRRLFSWAQRAGLGESALTPSARAWCYASARDRSWFAESWAERCVKSNFANQAIELGLTDADGLLRLAEAFRAWAAAPAGWFTILHGELIARVCSKTAAK